MGSILQIRLLASTPRPEDAFSAWPRLCMLAWPDQGQLITERWHPYNAGERPSSVFPHVPASYGVLELTQGLLDQARFGGWPPDRLALLDSGLKTLAEQQHSLERALGDWNASLAHQAATLMEDCLDDMEKLLA